MSENNTITNKPLIDEIHEAWKTAQEKQMDVGIFKETKETVWARGLEQLLSDRLESPMENFNQGLISASEFVLQVQHLSSLPREEGE